MRLRIEKRGKTMKENVKLYDVVVLTVDLPEYKLKKSYVGTIVESLANGSAFEVEFSDSEGNSYASLGLREDQLIIGWLMFKWNYGEKLIVALYYGDAGRALNRPHAF